MSRPRLSLRGIAPLLLSVLTLAASCPTPSPPPPGTTVTTSFDDFRLDVPSAGRVNDYDRTFPIFAGPQAADFSLEMRVANLPPTGRIEIQRGDGSVIQTITANGSLSTGMFGGNVGKIRVRLPGTTQNPPDVSLTKITTQRLGTKQFPVVSPSGRNLVTAFPIGLGEPVDFVISDTVMPDDAYFSVAGLGNGQFDVILTGAAAVWFEDPLAGAFPLSATEASQPPYLPPRGTAEPFTLPGVALFRFAGGLDTLKITVTNQGLMRRSDVRDPFHVRLIVVAAGAEQRLSFPSITPSAFGPQPIGVDRNPRRTRGTTGTAADQLDCTNWAGHSPGSVNTVAGVTVVTPAGPLVCYDGHSGSDFLVVRGTEEDLGIPVSAAASGFVVQTATGNVDNCGISLTAQGIYCPGTNATRANFVIVRQDDGLFARYYHLKNEPPPVQPGDRVMCSQFLGHVGSSGISATPHLHFELDRLSPVQVSPVMNDVDQRVWDLIQAGAGVVVDPYPGSWARTGPGTVPLPACP
jgi:hypothetical protein